MTLATSRPTSRSTPSDDEFRAHAATWLAEHVVGEYAELKGRGGPGDEDVGFDIRVAWEQRARRGRLDRPRLAGRATAAAARRSSQQIIWAEEYARAEAPARVNHMGENLLAPDADRVRHPRAAGAVPARHPATATSAGARATASPTPAPTSPTCRRGPRSTATSG